MRRIAVSGQLLLQRTPMLRGLWFSIATGVYRSLWGGVRLAFGYLTRAFVSVGGGGGGGYDMFL